MAQIDYEAQVNKIDKKNAPMFNEGTEKVPL
jgi:hypothetical protein